MPTATQPDQSDASGDDRTGRADPGSSTPGSSSRGSSTGNTSGGGDWKETLGRVGLVGRGVLFGIIGLLAMQLATGDAANDASTGGALEWLGSQPLGKFLLVALTVALFALAAWRLLDAVFGDPAEGSEPHDRIRYGGKGVFYLALAVGALSATISNWTGGGGSGSSGGGESERKAAATVLEWPGGRWLVSIVGLAVIVWAVYLVKQHVVDQEFTERVDDAGHGWLVPFGRVGYAARSVAYGMVGYFLVHAGVTYDPQEATGLSGALQELSGHGWGQIVLWFVAAGLLAFGLFTIAESKYRHAA